MNRISTFFFEDGREFRTSKLPLLLTIIAFVIVYAPTFYWLYQRWMMGVWYHAHGILVPMVSGYMVWKKINTIGTVESSGGSPIGLFFLIPAILLHVIDTVIWTQILSALSIVPAIIGLCFLFFGRSVTLSLWFPLTLLVFMIPVPSGVVQPIILFLRTVSAIGVSLILPLLGIAFIKSGTMFELKNATVNIGDPCSGFATLSATLAFTVAAVYLWPVGLLRALTLILLAFPVAIVANIIRNIILIALVLLRGPAVLDTFLHPLSGYFMYFLAMILQTWILLTFRSRKPAE